MPSHTDWANSMDAANANKPKLQMHKQRLLGRSPPIKCRILGVVFKNQGEKSIQVKLRLASTRHHLQNWGFTVALSSLDLFIKLGAQWMRVKRKLTRTETSGTNVGAISIHGKQPHDYLITLQLPSHRNGNDNADPKHVCITY